MVMFLLIPLQIIIFMLHPLPTDVQQWYALFHDSWLLGLVSLDLLYIIDNSLVALVYLALYQLLKDVSPSRMRIALLLGFLGIAAYWASNPAFEMWHAQQQFQLAQDSMSRQTWLIVGETLLLQWRGTAFITYYILNGVSLILISSVLLHSNYPKRIGRIGLVSGILMSIPSTFGMVGLICSLLSLIPWLIFLAYLIPIFWKQEY